MFFYVSETRHKNVTYGTSEADISNSL